MRQPEWSEDWPELWKRAYLNDAAEFWGRRVDIGYTYAYQRRFNKTMNLFERHVPAGATVVDVAAGQGNFTLGLAERGYDVTWNDLRGELAGYVQLKHERGTVAYEPGDAFALVGTRRFDAVLATEIIEHVAHPDRFLSRLRELCAPGGVLVLSTPNGSYVRSHLPTFVAVEDFEALEAVQFRPGAEGHLFLFTNSELLTLARVAGFRPLEVVNFTTPLLAGDMGRVGHGLRYVPERPVHLANAVVERLSRRLCMNTAAVFRSVGESLGGRTALT